jgi:hypothetical protein
MARRSLSFAGFSDRRALISPAAAVFISISKNHTSKTAKAERDMIKVALS